MSNGAMKVETSMDQATMLLSSSLRTRSAEESLAIAEPLAFGRGVSRVVDTTWLDRIGIPVYASIRPDAQRGSVAVCAGKGYTRAEAKIGAYMEAIEFSFAAPGRSRVTDRLVSPLEILESFASGIRFPDFCPRAGGPRIGPDEKLAAVEGEEILEGLGRVLVPAELVYHPAALPGLSLYGTSTNGLASGNTLREATAHALAEVMERHVHSFDIIEDRSVLVSLDDAPPKVRDMAARIERAGFQIHLRYTVNGFGLPMCSAYLLEPDERAPNSVACGFGLHANSDVAAVRAVAEAVQSRLTFIHGGRDDIVRRHDHSETLGAERELSVLRELRAMASNAAGRIAFSDMPSANATSIAQAEEAMYAGLRAEGLNHLVRVTYTEPDYPFQVVRVIVPGAECYSHVLKRVGPRLLKRFHRHA